MLDKAVILFLIVAAVYVAAQFGQFAGRALVSALFP